MTLGGGTAQVFIAMTFPPVMPGSLTTYKKLEGKATRTNIEIVYSFQTLAFTRIDLIKAAYQNTFSSHGKLFSLGFVW